MGAVGKKRLGQPLMVTAYGGGLSGAAIDATGRVWDPRVTVTVCRDKQNGPLKTPHWGHLPASTSPH